MAEQIIKISEAAKIYKLSVSSIYRLSSQGKFPKIIKISDRSSGLIASECEQWLTERIEASRNGEV